MKHWYALRSKPKKESLAASLLTRAGIEVYVPQAKTPAQSGKPAKLEPFFPSYLFSRLDPTLGDIRLASYTSGILHIVGFGGQPCPVPDSLILGIQQKLAQGRGQNAVASFRPGDNVTITGGPLHGVEAVFDCKLSRAGRVRVLIQMLERAYRTELDVMHLKRASKAANQARS